MRKNLLLLLIFIALGAYIYLQEKETKVVEEIRPPLISQEGLEKLSLVSEYGELTLEFKDGLWWMTSPHTYLANQEIVEKSLRVMSQSHPLNSFSLEEDRFGFNPGRAFFEFIYASSLRSRFIVGLEDAVEQRLYLLDKDSQVVHVMHNVWGQLLYYPLKEFLHQSLPIPGAVVKSVSLYLNDELKWSVKPKSVKEVEIKLGEKTLRVNKAKLLWFFKSLREFKLNELNFDSFNNQKLAMSLLVESNKGNIRFLFDEESKKIIIPSLNVFAEYDPFSLKSLNDEIAKVVKSDKK